MRFETATGTPRWDSKLPAGGNATPAVYAVAGRQYVAIAAGGREDFGKLGDTVVVYTLDGTGADPVFQHGVAVRMSVLASVGVLLLAALVSVPVWWLRRRRARRR
ncbi:hypothetical protein [Xanthomonas maliensis]|uniref:hypothetical protein n=1 Tax=Xanthomonas maliensis TaxID=1321368 RepID=UPI001EE2BA78|nr:hypothetical protein [Xanthomonas maliensis]